MSDVEEISLIGEQPPRLPATDGVRLQASGLGASPLSAGTRLQEFEISAVIGQGGFGIVYLARDLSLQRMVAIKEYMPAHLAGRNADATVRPLISGQSEVFELGRRSFINEARMLARFKHPGLLEVLRFWEQNGTAYMAMPYYDGATLTQYLKRHPGIATEEWLKRTLRPLVEALGHMHEEDCFHRDVAPDNILILKDGSAVLLDLGAARRVIADDAQAMTVMLKPGYAPIEQYSDDPRFRQGPWTDIYAMAAVFFFGVTGKAPPASASRVMRDSVSPLASVRPEGFSDAFLRAIDQGLSLQPEDRPRSIAEFRSLLFAAMPSLPAAPAQPARKPAAKPADGIAASGLDDAFAPAVSGSRTSVMVAGGLAVLALVLAGSWYVMQPAATPGEVEAVLAPPAKADPTRAVPSPADAEPARIKAVTDPARADPARADPATANSATAALAIPSAAADAPFASATPPREAATPAATPLISSPPAPAPDGAAVDADASVPGAAPARAAPGAAPADAAPVKPAAKVKPVEVKPAAESTSAAKPTAAGMGTVVLAVKPWAEVRVNGVVKGVSPPLKQLTLPTGRHTIELRNPASAPVTKQIEVRSNQRITISQQF